MASLGHWISITPSATTSMTTGFFATDSRRKHFPNITTKHLQVAKGHLKYEWIKVLWLDRSMQHWHAWHLNGHAYTKWRRMSTLKHSSGSVMFCSWLNSTGPGAVVETNGLMEPTKCTAISGDNLAANAWRLRLGHRWTSQQDNDPKLTKIHTEMVLRQNQCSFIFISVTDIKPAGWTRAQLISANSNVTDSEWICKLEWSKIPTNVCLYLVKQCKKILCCNHWQQ